MTNEKKKKSLGFISKFDDFMDKVRKFFTEPINEMKRCTWPARSELVESTILVVVSIVILGVFVAGVDILARIFVRLITTGSF